MSTEDKCKSDEHKALHQRFLHPPLPQGKVAAAHFKAPRPPESHRGRHRRQRDTPGCNWQLSTRVSRCHFLCQFAPRHIRRPWNNTPESGGSRFSAAPVEITHGALVTWFEVMPNSSLLGANYAPSPSFRKWQLQRSRRSRPPFLAQTCH